MRNFTFCCTLAASLILQPCIGQDKGAAGRAADKKGAEASMHPQPRHHEKEDRRLVADSSVTTTHEVNTKGGRIHYRATAGSQPVWDEKDNVVASLYYTYYERLDAGDKATRPLVFSFNGGPGAGSVWMHLGYTGPRLLRLDTEGYPIQPYGLKDNPYTILDVADIVYVNPVHTGYSRQLDKDSPREKFFGVKADIAYLAEWISTFVTRQERWLSPKFLIGESYGTVRVSGLALELQESQWLYVNGVILVSPTDLGIARNGIVKTANALPYFAATAWYHKALNESLQQKKLADLLPEVEQFSANELIPALTKGGFIDPKEREAIAERVARYSGLSKAAVLQNNLQVSPYFFWKELLRSRGLTVGRLDSRYLGIDKRNAGDGPDYNAELSAWIHAFTPAINHYLRVELGYKTDVKYNILADVSPWDGVFENYTGENLRQAMAQNPHLNVMIQSGYFDGATNYFDAKYSMWHLDPSGKMQSRLRWKGYESGHMMYVREKDLEAATNDIKIFIKDALASSNGKPAKY